MLYKDKSWLENMYLTEKLSTYQISKIVGCDKTTINNWLRKFGINIREQKEASSIANKGKERPEEVKKMISQNSKREKHWAWKGGKALDNRGYVRVLKPEHPFANCNGHVFEHRLVIEEMIGRFLERSEVVHHINGNTSDNREGNLFLFKDNNHHKHFHKLQRREEKPPMKYEYEEVNRRNAQ